MSTITLSTRLDAVNTIIGTIGEAPVSSLVATTADAAVALTLLNESLRSIQNRGWLCNTEYDVPLKRDNVNEIAVPANALKLEIPRDQYGSGCLPVRRGSSLYDAKGRTRKFSRDFTATVVYLLDFEDLPESLRRYVTINAARLFQARYDGDTVVNGFTQAEEFSAKAMAEEDETDTANTTLLDNWSVGHILHRR